MQQYSQANRTGFSRFHHTPDGGVNDKQYCQVNKKVVFIVCFAFTCSLIAIVAQDVEPKARQESANIQTKSKPSSVMGEAETGLKKDESPSSVLPSIIDSKKTIDSADNAPKTYVRVSKFEVDPPIWFIKERTSEGEVDRLPISEFGFGGEEDKELFESAVLKVVESYLDEILGPDAHHHVKLSVGDLRSQSVIAAEEIRDGIYVAGGRSEPTWHYYAILEFDAGFRDRVEKTWLETRQTSRLVGVAVLSGSVFLVIALLLGTLRMNSATSGFYQGRLQFLGGVVILGIIAAGFYFGSQLDWI